MRDALLRGAHSAAPDRSGLLEQARAKTTGEGRTTCQRPCARGRLWQRAEPAVSCYRQGAEDLRARAVARHTPQGEADGRGFATGCGIHRPAGRRDIPARREYRHRSGHLYAVCRPGSPGGALAGMCKVPDRRVSRWQSRLIPLRRRLAGGCKLNRDIPALIESAGFGIKSDE